MDEQGESHLSKVEVELTPVEDYAPGVPPAAWSESQPAGVAYFLCLPAGWLGDFHPAPARQWVVQLQGRLAVTMSDGTTVETGAGTAWLVEDTSGKGHRTQVVSDVDSVSLVTTLA
jgi:hypothetical protein